MVYCVDSTGVANAKVIQIYGNMKKRVATYGDMIYVVVKSLDKSSGNLLDEKQRKKFRKGTLHRAIIVHTKKKFRIYMLYFKKCLRKIVYRYYVLLYRRLYLKIYEILRKVICVSQYRLHVIYKQNFYMIIKKNLLTIEYYYVSILDMFNLFLVNNANKANKYLFIIE